MPSQGKCEHILVVDDDQLGRTAIQFFLRRAGYTVEAVPGAEEALASLERERYDLVITDNQMPGMSGTELALAIKTRWPLLPIVMFSAYPPEDPTACLDLVVTKPSGLSVLSKSVRQILDRATQ
jgi:CheY-like chemotaxis protein